jgi:hypothetical protein
LNQQDTNTFKDSTSLTKWTKWFLYLNIIIAVVSIASTSFEYKFFSDIKVGVYTSSELILADSVFNDTLQSLVDILQLLVFAVSGVLILRWIYISNYNAHQLSNSRMKFTPGWSIGWYFIPIFNLWKPYQAMKEIWKISANPTNWKKQSAPSMLRWWWFFWIADGFFSKLSFQFEMRASEINELMRADLIYLISDSVFIILSFSLLTIIDEIYKMQISNYSIKDDFTGGDYKDKKFNEEDVNIAIVFSATNNSRWELLHANLDKSKQYLDNSGWIKKDNYLYVISEANDDGLYQYVQLGCDSNDFPVLRAGFMSYSEILDDSTKPFDSLMIHFDDEVAFNNIVQSITESLEKIIAGRSDIALEFILYEFGGLVLDDKFGKNFVERSGFKTSDYVGFSTESDEAEVLFDIFLNARLNVAEPASDLMIKLAIVVLNNIMQKYSLGKYKFREIEEKYSAREEYLEQEEHHYKELYNNIPIFLKSQDIDMFYHFTDEKNLESIIKNGGLYSWKGLENEQIDASLSSNKLSRQLDTQKNFENYIRLSFTDYHPMSTKVEIEDGKKLIWLEIDLEVALWESTLFSDINATDNNVTVKGDFDFLKTLDFNIFKQRYNTLDTLEKKGYQAEILVKDFLPIKYIKNIYTVNQPKSTGLFG